MRLHKVGIGVISAALFAAFTGSAIAEQQPLVTFAFSDLSGAFGASRDGQSGLFTAADDLATTGDVTRVAGATPTDETAVFPDSEARGFPDPAGVLLQLPIEAVTQDSASTSGGSMTLRDIDGDSFVLGIQGVWTRISDFGAWFVGMVTDVQVNTGGNAVFQGADGTGFSMLGLPVDDLTGTVLALAVPGWFADANGGLQEFEGTNVGSVGAIVPEPVTLSLLAFGGLALISRRKRRTP